MFSINKFVESSPVSPFIFISTSLRDTALKNVALSSSDGSFCFVVLLYGDLNYVPEGGTGITERRMKSFQIAEGGGVSG